MPCRLRTSLAKIKRAKYISCIWLGCAHAPYGNGGVGATGACAARQGNARNTRSFCCDAFLARLR